MARDLTPNVGDLAYNLSLGGFSSYYRRVRVAKVTPKQIEVVDQLGRRTRYWRANGDEVGGFKTNCLTLGPPPPYAKEPKQLVGKPDPEIA